MEIRCRHKKTLTHGVSMYEVEGVIIYAKSHNEAVRKWLRKQKPKTNSGRR